MAPVRYICNGKDPLTQLFCDTPSPTQKDFLKYKDGPLVPTPKETDAVREKALLEKTGHGVFFMDQQVPTQVDCEQLWRWLQIAGLYHKTEVAICAVQEQVLATNNIQKKSTT
eukprot:10458651-Ditylum_brightwellii.AAC.2